MESLLLINRQRKSVEQWKVPRSLRQERMPSTARGKEGKRADTHTTVPEQQGAFINKKDRWNGRRDVTWEIASASRQWRGQNGETWMREKNQNHTWAWINKMSSLPFICKKIHEDNIVMSLQHTSSYNISFRYLQKE